MIRELLAGAALCWSLYAQPKDRLHDVPDLDKNLKTGPAVGSPIPPFEIVDQNAKCRPFNPSADPKVSS